MADEEREAQDQGQEDEEEGLSEEERRAIISDFAGRIEANEFEGRSFHGVVRSELYPLLAEGQLSADEFSRLVRKWAQQNYPLGWPVRSYQEE